MSLVKSSRHLLRTLVWLAVGCGDDTQPAADTTDASTGTETTGTTTSATTDATATNTTASTQLEIETETILYPQQPMVVDVVVSLSRPGTVELSHATDAGVVIDLFGDQPDPTVHTFRVRGLAPAKDHTLDVLASADDDDTEAAATVDLTTEAALPGFVGAFALETTNGQPHELYRLFDMGGFPAGEAAGLFVADWQGVTRWYLGEADPIVGPHSVWAAARLRDDGAVMYLRDYAMHVVDELGESLQTIDPETLGVPGLHHELLELPNGNLVTLAHTFRDVEDPVDGTVYVGGDLIVELTSEGDVLWTWDTFDHLDPLRKRDGYEIDVLHPQTQEPAKDWTHANGLEYDPEADTFLLSLRHQDWIVAIDHATGDVLWLLGDEGDFTLVQGTWFFHPHSPQWQPDGSLLLYDNGVGNPDVPDDQETSRAVRYVLDEGTMEVMQVWEDDAEDFVAPIAGDADLLPDGRIQVLDSSITDGPGQFHARIRELDPEASPMTVWSMVSPPSNFVYRATAHERLVGQPAP